MFVNDSAVRAEHEYRTEQLKKLYQQGRGPRRNFWQLERDGIGRTKLTFAKLRSAKRVNASAVPSARQHRVLDGQ